MDGELDLFASTQLFENFGESFSGSKPSKNAEKSEDESSASENIDEVQLNDESDADNNCITLDTDQDELIVLDETGSSDSDINDGTNGKNCLRIDANGDLSGNDDHDIQVIESEEQTSTSNPPEITLEDDVNELRSKNCPNCLCKIELSRLNRENASLRHQITHQESKFSAINKPELGIEIRFLNPSAARSYRTSFEDFLKTLKTSHEENSVTNDTKADPEVFSDFCIDKIATSESAKASTSGSSVWKVPRYNQDVKEVLQTEEVEVIEETLSKASAKATCFNCLGDHMIANCPKEKDRRRIQENREAYMSKCGNNKATRYHADEDIRFANLKPGRISDNLRKALGITKQEVPFFIYKMRLLGYPPGWLKEAEITSSGLTVYDSEGKEVIEDNVEDGEVYEASAIRVQHDPDKLVEYPGFNVFLPYGVKDDHMRFGFPPIQNHHLKSSFGKSMKAPEATPFKRRVSQNATNGKKPKLADKNTNYDDVEMEVEEIDIEANEQMSLPSTSSNQQKQLPTSDKADSDLEISMPGSPSLEELEQVKKNLLDVLSTNSASIACSSDANESVSQDSQLGPNFSHNSQSEAKPVNGAQNGARTEEEEKDNNSVSASVKQASLNTPELARQMSKSKSMELGSPSIITASSLNLPEREHFSVGITEHIPFENLPGATGQYEKLRNVLKTIRSYKS